MMFFLLLVSFFIVIGMDMVISALDDVVLVGEKVVEAVVVMAFDVEIMA